MRFQTGKLLSTAVVGVWVCATAAVAADPVDTVLVTQSGPNLGLWRLAHSNTGYPGMNNFYDELGKPDRGGSQIYNKSDAGWTPQPNLPLVGDVTGDGLDDIVTIATNPANNSPTFFVNETVEVNTGIGMITNNTADFWDGTDSAGVHFFLADINGDGNQDAINVKQNGSIYQWTAYHSTGSSFGLRTWAFTQEEQETPLVGDFNGDGIDDIGVRFESGALTPIGFIKFYLSDPDGDGLQSGGDPGTGTHDGYTTAEIVQGSVADQPNHIATLVGDINGDGIDDIVEVDDRNSTGRWVWVAGVTGASGSPSGYSIGAGGTSFAQPFAPDPTETVKVPFLADIDGNGYDDLVLYREFMNDGWTFGQWLVALNTSGTLTGVSFTSSGTTRLRNDTDNNLPLIGQFGAPVPPEDCDNGLIDDDFDGLADCLDPDCELSPDCVCYGLEDDTVLFNAQAGAAGAGNWAMAHTRCGADQLPWHAGDFYQSGPVKFNNATYTPNPNLPLLGDVNGDGFDDIVTVASNGGVQVFAASYTYDANEEGTGLLGPSSPSDFVGTSQDGVQFLLADINGDGYDDALNVKPIGGPPATGYQVTAYHSGPDGFEVDNNGDMVDDKSWMFINHVPDNPVFAADFNGDGIDDVGIRFENGVDTPNGWIKVYLSSPNGYGLQNGNDTGDPADGYDATEIVQGKVADQPNPVATLIGDINADGLADIVEVDDRNGNGQWVWVTNPTGACGDPSGLCIAAGSTSFDQPLNVGTTATVAEALLADINGDGYDDLVAYREYAFTHANGDTAGQWLVALNDADGDLFGITYYDQQFEPLDDGWEGNVPLIGQFDLSDPVLGACCLGDLTCIEVTEDECINQNGTYQGDDTLCADTVCCPDPFADIDQDGDVDSDDFGELQRCLVGTPFSAGGSVTAACECFDRDGDGNIDADDILAFTTCSSGPAVPADDTCDD